MGAEQIYDFSGARILRDALTGSSGRAHENNLYTITTKTLHSKSQQSLVLEGFERILKNNGACDFYLVYLNYGLKFVGFLGL